MAYRYCFECGQEIAEREEYMIIELKREYYEKTEECPAFVTVLCAESMGCWHKKCWMKVNKFIATADERDFRDYAKKVKKLHKERMKEQKSEGKGKGD